MTEVDNLTNGDTFESEDLRFTLNEFWGNPIKTLFQIIRQLLEGLSNN